MLSRKARENQLLLLALPLLLFPLWGQDKPYIMFVGVLTLMYISLTMSLRLKLSAYLLDIAGHLAWVGIGAYLSTVFTMRLGISFWLNIFIVPIIVGFISILIAAPAIRARGVYLAVVTIAFAELVRLFFSNMWKDVFGGQGGIWDIPGPSALGPFTFTKEDHVTYYYLMMAILVITVYFLRRIDRSRIGLVFRSIREQEVLSESVGVNVTRMKVICWAISCAMAGAVGVFWAAYIHVIVPDDFSVLLGFVFMIYVVVGGRAHLLGPALGVVLFVIVTEALRTQGVDEYQPFFLGGALILFILFIPDGLSGLYVRQQARLQGWWRRRRLAALRAAGSGGNPAPP